MYTIARMLQVAGLVILPLAMFAQLNNSISLGQMLRFLVVGACLAIERLGIERIVCSPIPTGSGTVECDHGVMPVPAEALTSPRR